jgi:hypothetical protein
MQLRLGSHTSNLPLIWVSGIDRGVAGFRGVRKEKKPVHSACNCQYFSLASLKMSGTDPDVIMTDTTTPTQTWSLPRSRRLDSSDLSKQRSVLKHKGHVYHACPKTAHKRGGYSFIWEHGTELRRKGIKKPDWLCNLCWDRNVTEIYYTSSTTPAITHLEKCHRIGQHGPIPQSETGSVLAQMQTEDSNPTTKIIAQVEMNAFKSTLIKWIIVTHMALSCVEVQAFRDLILLLNPAIWALMYKAGNSIKKLILRDYEERKEKVREDLRNALSKIHISVVARFLG